MKLLLCLVCQDIIRLQREIRQCKCGLVEGHYLADGINAEYSGDNAIPIGFANISFVKAINSQPENGPGREFTAFVIPKHCCSMKKKG